MNCEICDCESGISEQWYNGMRLCYSCFDGVIALENNGIATYVQFRYGYVIYKIEIDATKRTLENLMFYELEGELKYTYVKAGFVTLKNAFVEKYQPKLARIVFVETDEYKELFNQFFVAVT